MVASYLASNAVTAQESNAQEEQKKAWDLYENMLQTGGSHSALARDIVNDFPGSTLAADVTWHEMCSHVGFLQGNQMLSLSLAKGELRQARESARWRSAGEHEASQSRQLRELRLGLLKSGPARILTPEELSVLLTHKPTRVASLEQSGIDDAAKALARFESGEPEAALGGSTIDAILATLVGVKTGVIVQRLATADRWTVLQLAYQHSSPESAAATIELAKQMGHELAIDSTHVESNKGILRKALGDFVSEAGKYDKGRLEATEWIKKLDGS